MIPQNDIQGKDPELYNEYTSIRRDNQSFDSTLDTGITSSDQTEITKPSNFVSEFPEITAAHLTENSPIRPSKFFANDSAVNNSRGLRRIISGGIIFSLCITIALIIQILVGPTQIPNRIGIVTREKICSDIGADMVQKGGNSIDAFISSSLCLSVVNPFAAGLGAGGFLLVRDHKHEKNYALNCFFKSSTSADIEDYKENPVIGRKSVAIPGELKCLQEVYHKYARFYWNTLADPAIKLARNGFKVSQQLARHLRDLDVENDIKKDSLLKEMFLDAGGNLVTEGAIVKNPKLADTLEQLAKKETIFYQGEIGKEMINTLQHKSDLPITFNDLSSYSAQETSPNILHYKDFILMTSSYPSVGPALKFIMDLMSSFPINLENIKSSATFSQIVKATKIGYIFSSYISDPHFGVQQSELYNEKIMLAKKYLENKNDTEFPFGEQNIKLNDDFILNYISVNDHNDLMVSYVGTLGKAWGSRILTKNGYFLNNGLSLFSYESDQNPDKSNFFELNKQPRGLMTPILTYNQKNPCIRRFAISYSHHGEENDDYSLSELSQVILKVFTDFSLYENSIGEKRLQYWTSENGSGVCFENNFDSKIEQEVLSDTKFSKKDGCTFHSIDLVMKKDHIIYGKADSDRSNDSLVVIN
ncbi:unnamed protein product [Brachionus calyciflorus]|uniref:Uncharacterized protein n=1 Tax=Brachionus calyciflorus TaxID=104777 RepID=A0A814E4P0_9BILA|nr:unnamed protein product [Brachionus calyciflorus]